MMSSFTPAINTQSVSAYFNLEEDVQETVHLKFRHYLLSSSPVESGVKLRRP